MEEDKELREAVEACSKIIEEKCGRKPYMLVVTKANLRVEKGKESGRNMLTGTASYMYFSKPRLKKDGISKLLVDTSRVALNAAEKRMQEEEAKPRERKGPEGNAANADAKKEGE